MNRYKRRHTSGNMSKGIYWIMFAAMVAYIIFKVVQFKRKVDGVHKTEMLENPPR